jgi:methionyl-tRNA formyltransferase
VRCLKVLLAGGVDVALVVTHEDSATRTSGSNPSSACARPRASLHHAARRQIAGIAGAGEGGRPDFIFSFYYRHMLPASLLAVAPAFNMHGSLLPEYRGRAPVNWAVLHGATETGATLHEMTVKPDAGAIVADGRAHPARRYGHEVFGKVTVAAEQALWRVLLLDGTAPRLHNDLSKGGYFSGRKPEDGRIDWHAGAAGLTCTAPWRRPIRALHRCQRGALCDRTGPPGRPSRRTTEWQPTMLQREVCHSA